MTLSALLPNESLAGRFVYDHGDWTRVGCTAVEIAAFLEDPGQRDGTVYRIHRAYPDGRMELQGVATDRWQLESGMFFFRESAPAARSDYEHLTANSEVAPPCRCFVHLTDRGPRQPFQRYMTALVYPSEYEEDIAAWLLEREFAGGDTVEGGISLVTNYYAEEKQILARTQLWSRSAGATERSLVRSA